MAPVFQPLLGASDLRPWDVGRLNDGIRRHHSKFSRESYGPGVRNISKKNAFQPVPVRRLNFGKIQTGAYKRGLKPQIFRENRAKILPGKSGLFGPDWSLFRPYRGLFGADWDRFPCTSQPRGGSKNSPERAFLGPIGAFWAKPPFAKPPFGFPQEFTILDGPAICNAHRGADLHESIGSNRFAENKRNILITSKQSL